MNQYTPLNIENILLQYLKPKRHIFHSESDFKHALAWEIQHTFPNANIRLEYKPPAAKSRIYIDIWVEINHSCFAIELKYKTRALNHIINKEKYELLNQSAQDCGRYDFLKDVQRLEEVTSNNEKIFGYALMLTNDSTYWKVPHKNNTVDANFRIHEGRLVEGRLNWSKNASEGTKRGRNMPIKLINKYSLSWKDYNKLWFGKNPVEFRYLCIDVNNI